MIKVLFLIHSLGGGGAERVLVNLVNHLDKTKYDVTVETLFKDGVNRKFLSPDVHYYCHNAFCFRGISYLYKFIPAKVLYRHYVGETCYDIVIAYLQGIPTKVISGSKDNAKTITWLHNTNLSTGSFFTPWFTKKFAFSAYRHFSKIVGVSKSVSSAFSNYTGIKNNVVTLYNTNDTDRIIKLSKSKDICFNKTCPVFCSAGKLINTKGYDRLIVAASNLKREGYHFQVLIMGVGDDETNLKELCKTKCVEDCVKFLGFCENPYCVMAQSDFFISSSRVEGLATVLTEALTVGLPCISTDVSGAKEVLGESNEYGLVVENSEEGIYEGMKRFLTEPELTNKYRTGAKDRAKLFDTEHTVKAVEQMLEELCQN